MTNPTFTRIKDLKLEKTSVADNDWFVLEDSADSFKTKKVKGQYIGANIYKNDGTLTGNRTVTMSGNSLTFSGGTVKTISPSASALDIAFGVRNNTNTSYYSKVLGCGTTVLSADSTQLVNTLEARVDGNHAGKYAGEFINNCVATGAKPAIRAISQADGANSENYGILAIAQNGLALNTAYRGLGYGGTGILGVGIHGSTESGWGAGGYFTAPSGHAEAFATITTTKNLHKKFTNATGLPPVNNMDGQFGAGAMASMIVVESTTGLTIAISNGTNWIDIRTNLQVVI